MSEPGRGGVIRLPVSRRSKIIIVLSIIWVMIGSGVLFDAQIALDGMPPHYLIPSWIRGLTWILTGLFGIAAALTRWHKDEAIGGLMIMPVMRSMSYLWSWVMYLIPGDPSGVEDGWYFAAIHAALIVAVWAVASSPHERGDE